MVAPALTLADREYQMLRSAALDIITALGIVGGCNCQFALNPDSFEYAVIEVNPRVSRSSALASKATGYPIAKISTKLALGYTLDEITNDITGKTCACFEPALDYVVVKVPKWPFDKFPDASRVLGTQMKATGEVMSIAPNFELALAKALRGIGKAPAPGDWHVPDDRRIWSILEALKQGTEPEEIHQVTKIDRWFLRGLKNMSEWPEHTEEDSGLPVPYKMVDTCAAEFDAQTPYFYAGLPGEECEARAFLKTAAEAAPPRPVVMVLGSGPIRIGQGIEFDYSSVHCVWTLREMGYDVVMVNNNPETVSTDYDTADRLYFEPLTPEDVWPIIEVEHPVGVVVAFGGQTAISLTKFLDSR